MQKVIKNTDLEPISTDILKLDNTLDPDSYDVPTTHAVAEGITEAINEVVPQNSYTAQADNTTLPLKVDANGKLTNNGSNLTVTGGNAWAEGIGTKATKSGAHSEGYNTTAGGVSAHAEGYSTIASGNYSHAEGDGTTASASTSHAEGSGNTVSGFASHVGGSNCSVSGKNSFAHGDNLNTTNVSNAWFGKFNADEDVLLGVGNGTGINARKNAFKVDKNGDLWGNVDGTIANISKIIYNGSEGDITETPPALEYTPGNLYIINGLLMRCVSYTASEAEFVVTSLIEEHNNNNA